MYTSTTEEENMSQGVRKTNNINNQLKKSLQVETDCGILVDELKEIPESSKICYLWHGTRYQESSSEPVVSITKISRSANQVADELDRLGRKEVSVQFAVMKH
jgi:hypothetical protein